jgi:hypothetical protein
VKTDFQACRGLILKLTSFCAEDQKNTGYIV